MATCQSRWSFDIFAKLSNLFWFRTWFGASESLSRSLQAVDLSQHEVLSAVKLAKSFYQRQRTNESFNLCYDKAVEKAKKLQIDDPRLPRCRK